MWRAAVINLGIALTLGCGHHERSASTSTSAPLERAKEDFVSAYDAVKSGAKRTASAGKYALQSAGQGVVRFTRESTQKLSQAGGAVEDAWITAQIKHEYATDELVKASQLHVDTNEGIVQVSGVVADSIEAERAIDIALGTKGVVAVDSRLQWPKHHVVVPGPRRGT